LILLVERPVKLGDIVEVAGIRGRITNIGSGDNALLFRVDFWLGISIEPDWRRVASDIRQRIEALFAEHGITIAFPQRDVHLDSPTPIKVEVVAHPAAAGEVPAAQPVPGPV
jgi:small-conductance mechanosensitive channel